MKEKKLTIKDRFLEMKYAAERSLRGEKVQSYLSGHKKVKTELEKMVSKYRGDAEIDFELGVISEEIYNYEIKISSLMSKNLENFIIY